MKKNKISQYKNKQTLNLKFNSPEEAMQILAIKYKLIIEGHTRAVIKLAISRDNKYIISGSPDKTIRV